MAYTQQSWTNGAAGATPISAARLTVIENGIAAAHDGTVNQPLDSDLTAIAALSPSNDDIIQRKTGAWTNRTMSQLGTDIPSRACHVYASSTSQTLTSGAVTTIDLNTTDFNDSASFYTISLAGNTVTVVIAGVYMVSYTVKFGGGGSTGQRYASVTVGGSIKHESGVGSANAFSAGGAVPLRLAASAVVALSAYQDGGSTIDVITGNSYETGISLAFLGA